MHATLSDTASGVDFAFCALRGHVPVAGLQTDEEGWADVPYVFRALKAAGHVLSRFAFERLVMTDSARRFLMSTNRHRIRAVPPQSAEAVTSAGDNGARRRPTVVAHGQ
jgi:RNA:NAD 2'-phosphotransferase (TPT1/KptA family)